MKLNKRLFMPLSLLLSSCAISQEDKIYPAVLVDAPTTLHKLEIKLAELLNKSQVTLKKDAFQTSNQVIIERPFYKDSSGRLIDGRRMELPTVVLLYKQNGHCFIKVHDQLHPISEISCKKIPPQ
ncbi:hypothetical protein [Parashewanella tropica]|uniref:hypothetical protein n=1 Tax=Parashewanella tropica TaxID=2547970 RepID=UPI00105AA136|nr:hypothetical protein [Parashewanella tropica]